VNATKTLRVAAFTSGAKVPGARFRVRQFIPELARAGITVDERWPELGAFPPAARWLRPVWLAGTLAERLPQVAQGWSTDVTWLYREMVSTLPTLERFTRRPRLLDVDDAIHLYRGGRTAAKLARAVDLVLVANDYLADAWRRWTNAVDVLPMAIDTDLYVPAALPEKPVIGWLGSPTNLHYLEQIAPALGEVLRRLPEASLAVCSERRPSLGGLPVRYVPWSPEAERPFIQSLTVGLVPIEDTEWGRGKFSYKLLQYMACGRACIASPVGTSRDLLARAPVGLAAASHDEWVKAITALIADPAAANEMGGAARALAVSDYSIGAVAPRLAAILRRLA
jgi:glycosyltransferase involved in cell wall biosynthesis